MVRILLVPALTPLYLYISTFRSMCAVPNTAVFCSSWTIIIIIIIIIIISPHGAITPSGPGPTHYRGFTVTPKQNHTR